MSEKAAKQHQTAGEKHVERGHAPESASLLTNAQSAMIHLQQSAGNRAVMQLMKQTAEPAASAGGSGGNRTGLPDGLKAGVESLSGISLDDVRVHYNSSEPVKLNALAYAEGNDIHVGPGQEKHLPHEAWHVVQQKQGRVSPTMQFKHVGLNDSPALEREADEMGTRAASIAGASSGLTAIAAASPASPTVQLFKDMDNDNENRLKQSRTDSGDANMQLDHSVSQDSMKTLAKCMSEIGTMIQPSGTKFTKTKAAYGEFKSVTGDPKALRRRC
ncbi:eCIS core domain-containing protein [Paenibacillus soyae]|uniref:DUF4157 domain-containing protein n=1 Tax=Paenibacillus soyae TaxID=2969249 RepID=A0A9X2MW70_9BACL|nr:DUF4157 domain-containing protein [Paenibacillus soyae]MCR2807585.1 DUF4157 domain-containing protein [Paenibacillus soyae]